MDAEDFDRARDLHVALKELILGNSGGWADLDTLHKVRILCRLATEAVDDPVCAQQIGVVENFAVQLYSERDHQRWNRGAMPGTDYLRMKILRALVAFHARLYSIQTLLRVAALERRSSRRRPI